MRPSRHTSRWKVEFRFAPACEGPGSFLRHELSVYIITRFWSLSGPQRRNKQEAYQNHYSQVWKAVTFACVTFVSLPCPTCRSIVPGQVKYVPPATACPVWAAGLMEHVLGEGDGNWQGLYIILRWKKGQWPLINTIFTHRAEKRQGWFYFGNFALYLSHATVNKQKTEENQLFLAAQLTWIARAALRICTTMRVIIINMSDDSKCLFCGYFLS